MTHSTPDPALTYVLGGPFKATQPLTPFDDLVCDFLAEFSADLRKHPLVSDHNDLAALSFWCRRANLNRIKQDFDRGDTRLGLGVVFHIAPSNVPVNFFYSYVFGLLAGNANVVRLPSAQTPQEDIICDVLKGLFADDRFSLIRAMTAFVRYPHNDEVTGDFSRHCDARVIWGGDATIADIRRLPVPVRATEIAFADRYSFCVMNDQALVTLGEAELGRLAEGFYNDTYLMDQNACSSPHLIVWLGGAGEGAERFWAALSKIVEQKYDLAPVHAVDKYTDLLARLITLECIEELVRHGNGVYRLKLSELPVDIDAQQGRFGTFLEYATGDFDDVLPVINNKYQTLTYFGIDKTELNNFILEKKPSGIDRIVPVGRALDIDVNWDGMNVLQNLSRLISVS